MLRLGNVLGSICILERILAIPLVFSYAKCWFLLHLWYCLLGLERTILSFIFQLAVYLVFEGFQTNRIKPTLMLTTNRVCLGKLANRKSWVTGCWV
jgi:hypothetical protein